MCLKEESACATDKLPCVISNIMLFKTVICTTKELKNKASLKYKTILYALLCGP